MINKKRVDELYTIEVFTNTVVIQGSMPVKDLMNLCHIFHDLGYTEAIDGDQNSMLRLSKGIV